MINEDKRYELRHDKVMGGDDPLLNILFKKGPNLLSNTPKERKEASPNLILTVNQFTSE